MLSYIIYNIINIIYFLNITLYVILIICTFLGIYCDEICYTNNTCSMIDLNKCKSNENYLNFCLNFNKEHNCMDLLCSENMQHILQENNDFFQIHI